MVDKERCKILDKACKLKELADRGVGGEMANAKRMLGEYQTKHKISDYELDNHKIQDTKQFKGYTPEQIIAMIAAELAYRGLTILANAAKSTLFNHLKMKDANSRFDKSKIIEIAWMYDFKNFTFKGYVEDTIYFDIQQTKTGATLYKSLAVTQDAVFSSVELAKEYCETNLLTLIKNR